MKPASISVEQIIQFARDHDGMGFFTLKRRSPFTIHIGKTGIRYRLPSGAYFPINRTVIAKYLKYYYASAPKSRTKTTIYPEKLRERSYMASIISEMEKERRTSYLPQRQRDGLDDLNEIPEGSECPDRAKSILYSVVRNEKVRAYVLRHAAGKCEYCGKVGFLMANGRHYVETHHIIALSKHGKDKVENVIALCPDHHREAHYGKKSQSLERTFVIRIRERKW